MLRIDLKKILFLGNLSIDEELTERAVVHENTEWNLWRPAVYRVV